MEFTSRSLLLSVFQCQQIYNSSLRERERVIEKERKREREKKRDTWICFLLLNYNRLFQVSTFSEARVSWNWSNIFHPDCLHFLSTKSRLQLFAFTTDGVHFQLSELRHTACCFRGFDFNWFNLFRNPCHSTVIWPFSSRLPSFFCQQTVTLS